MGLVVVKPKGLVIAGADFYHGNADATFKKYLYSQLTYFIFLKASEGLTVKDPALEARWPLVGATGKTKGVYHFFHPGSDPIKQAENFYRCAGHLVNKGDFIFCDWESTDGVGAAKDSEAAFDFLAECDKLFGVKCGIYGSPYFLQAAGTDSRFKDRVLWIAEYGVKSPKVPSPWIDWEFWQYDENGADQSYFNGSVDDLKALANEQYLHTTSEGLHEF